MEKIPSSFFVDLPKADLHCHLDGSLRLATLIDLAKQQNVTLPSEDPETLKKVLGFGEIHSDLVGYLKMFDLTCSVMQSEAALYRIAYELVEDAAKENVWHLEIRFCPTLHIKEGLSLNQVIASVIKGAQDAGAKYYVSAGIIICGLRTFAPEKNDQLIKEAVAFQNRGVIAVDLAGAELGHPAQEHASSFFYALSHYLDITIHAGEADSCESIKQALLYCHAKRIGHGTRLFESPELLGYMVNQQIPIEVCLSSNLQTHAVSDLKEHPARLYLNAGARVTLNTDNRLMSDTTLSREYELAHRYLGFNANEIKALSFNSFRSAFLPYQKKNELLERVFSRW